MKSFTWISSLFRTVAKQAGRPIRRTNRPQLEMLEDRSLPSSSPGLAAAYGTLPVAFEANQGQDAAPVDFLAHGQGYTLGLTSSEAILELHKGTSGDVLHLQLVGANPSAHVAGRQELLTKSNYLIGNDPSQWHTNIANYGKVEYQDVYQGINLVYYGNQGQLEYDFVAAPGADLGAIQLEFRGGQDIALDGHGDLILHTSAGELVEHAPVIYQEVDGIRRAVDGHYILEGGNKVGFAVGDYDHSQTLTIDPVLSYSTYLGGSGEDNSRGIAVDASGNAYIVGTTFSANFPTANGVRSAKPGTTSYSSVFVSKLNAAGTALVYSTYLGGTGLGDEGNGIAVNAAGEAYVTGYTQAADFPTTASAFQGVMNSYSGNMAFMTKLNASGSGILYSSFLGGTGDGAVQDQGNAIALDAAGNAYVTGTTRSNDFITTPGAFQPSTYNGWILFSNPQAFVSKIDPSKAGAASLVYSTYLRGSGEDYGYGIAVDSAGNAYVTGTTMSPDFPTTPGAFQTAIGGTYDAFVTKLNPAGSALVYSTYLGGTNEEDGDAIAVDGAGNAFITGYTQSAGLPTTSGAFQRTYGGLCDAFVTKLNPSGSGLVYSTFLGGSDQDFGYGISIDSAGNAYVTGSTLSATFPTTPDAMQRTKGVGHDAFMAKVNGAGSALVYSTYLGGGGDDYGSGIALDTAGNAYVVGSTNSTNFPTTPNALQPTNHGGYDAFVAAIRPSSSLAVSGFPSPSTAGVAGSFTLIARDINGAMAASYTGTVHFSSSDPQAVLPGDYTFTTADAGTHTFAATLKTAGSQAISVADVANAGIAGSQSGITVKAAAASTLIVAGFPSAITAGTGGSFTVTARDAFGNTATGYLATIAFGSSDGRATLPTSYTFTVADAGAHTFSATLKTAGTQSVTAKDTVSGSISGTDGAISVNPAAANLFVIAAPSRVTAGVPFSLTVTVKDAYGNVVTGYTGGVHFSSSDSTATLPANFTFTAADQGVHTFTGLVLRKKGTQKITLTDTLNSSLTGNVFENVL